MGIQREAEEILRDNVVQWRLATVEDAITADEKGGKKNGKQ